MLDVFIKVSGVVFPVFIVMGVGAYFMHTKTLSEQGNDNLKAMVYKLLMPIMVFAYLVKNPLDMNQGLLYIKTTVIYTSVLFIVCYGVAYLFLYRNARTAVLSSTTFIFPNNVYLGIPICAFAFGDLAILPAVIFGISFYVVPFYVLLGIQLTDSKHRGSFIKLMWSAFSGVASNPIFLGAVFGILWGQVGWQMPIMVDRAVSLISDANKMLALLTVGASLYVIYHDKNPLDDQSKISFRTEVIGVTAFKMIALPLLSLWVVSFIDIPPVWKAVFVLQSAMPFGVFIYFIACAERIFVRQLAVHVLVSTVVSMLSLPIFIVALWSIFNV